MSNLIIYNKLNMRMQIKFIDNSPFILFIIICIYKYNHDLSDA
jgi:hypothetical protein